MNINQECSHNKRGAGPIHLVECKAKPISFNSFYTSGAKVFKIDKANSESHVLSKIKTNSCYRLVCFIFDKTFLLVLYPLHNCPGKNDPLKTSNDNRVFQKSVDLCV